MQVFALKASSKLKGDVVVREITKADIERYKAIHAKFVKTIKDTYPTE